MKFLITAVIFAFLALACQAKDYDGYKTYRVYPKNEEQFYLLRLLEKSEDFDFWSSSHLIGHPTDIMVKPSKISFFQTLMYYNGFNASLMINNVGAIAPTPRNHEFVPADGRISFTQYERYATIQAYLRELATNNPSTVTLLNLGKTYENRDLLGVKISSGGSDKPAILVDAGIHAREWLAHATGLYIIEQLVNNPSAASLLDNVDWYIVPVLNPDGYEYTHTNDRFWRKTRSIHKRCVGTDANRNFGFHWNEVGASSDECSDIFAGPTSFSEPETIALKQLAEEIKSNVKLYLTFHSYGQYLLYPWGWTSAYPENRQELQSLAESVNTAIKAVRGTRYTIGSSTNVLYPAAGGSDDWMMGIAGVPLTYTIELPQGGNGGFNPPPSAIKGVVEETFEGVKVFGKYVAQL